MVHLGQLVVAFVLYFVVTYAVHLGVRKSPTTLTAVIIPGVFAYCALLLFTPHDSFLVRITYGVGLAGAGFVQHLCGKTLDKWNV